MKLNAINIRALNLYVCFALTTANLVSWDSILRIGDMSLVKRKPLFGVCDQGRLKPACAATEAE